MGTTLELILANAILCHFETSCLQTVVNDAFLLFSSKGHVKKFRNYLNKQHKNMKFRQSLGVSKNFVQFSVKLDCDNRTLSK